MPQKKNTVVLVIAVSLLIVGNLIGAGILALPIQTGLEGFVPALFTMLIVGAAMLYSAIILAKEATLRQETSFNYPSLYQSYLGPLGKWIAILANLVILYGLLTAYLTGATAIILNLFHLNIPAHLITLAFFLLITAIAIGGIKIVVRYNALLALFMFISFALIVVLAGEHMELQRFNFKNWRFLPFAVPVIITAFHFHNIIPNICRRLHWKFSVIVKTIFIGMLIGYVMNMIWIMVGIGSVPLEGGNASIVAAFQKNLPATVPMSNAIGSPAFVIGALIFALLAISTSYLANGLGLMGFIKDMTENQLHLKNRLLNLALTFMPPLIIAVFYPDIFLKAIDIVGGYGIAVLFGILPSIIAFKRARSSVGRAAAIAMLVLFSFFLCAEFAQGAGLIKIRPQIKSHNLR